MTADTNVIDAGARLHGRALAARVETVTDSLRDARYWIEAGLEGRIRLEEAACSADRALMPALREVLRNELL